MSGSKKKRRTPEAVPPPITIKKEKQEDGRALYTMSHYLDDRLEMVKQIFSTLKMKTITNLTPDFLKHESIEHIEEMCLTELVCISKKRLLSIINSTECPSDTDSSTDTDVEHQEEHVSLEEISSDSELDEGSAGKEARRKAMRHTKSNGVTNVIKLENGHSEDNAQMSVLELLELQARARAIRSQLALEPITKIEIGSDDENESKGDKEASSVSPQMTTVNKPIHPKTSEKESITATTIDVSAKAPIQIGVNSEVPSATGRKRIKLKRTLIHGYAVCKKAMKPNPEEPSLPAAPPTSKLTTQDVSSTPLAPKPNGSQSPDIIPIEPKSETVEILDSSEDEGALRKATVIMKLENTIKNQQDAMTSAATPEPNVLELKEVEEGEISESSSEDEISPKAMLPKCFTTAKDNKANEPAAVKIDKQTVVAANVPAATTTFTEKSSSSILQVGGEQGKVVASPIGAVASQVEDEYSSSDDVISLEGGDFEQLVDDMSQSSSPSKTAVKKEASAGMSSPTGDADCISLDSSETEGIDSGDTRHVGAQPDQENKWESWKMRYIKSDKMSKLLAQSRLSKRVRDKIRKNNQATKIVAEVEAADIDTSTDSQFSSRHEDGSIEQYNELLQFQQEQQQKQQQYSAQEEAHTSQ